MLASRSTRVWRKTTLSQPSIIPRECPTQRTLMNAMSLQSAAVPSPPRMLKAFSSKKEIREEQYRQQFKLKIYTVSGWV